MVCDSVHDFSMSLFCHGCGFDEYQISLSVLIDLMEDVRTGTFNYYRIVRFGVWIV